MFKVSKGTGTTGRRERKALAGTTKGQTPLGAGCWGGKAFTGSEIVGGTIGAKCREGRGTEFTTSLWTSTFRVKGGQG